MKKPTLDITHPKVAAEFHSTLNGDKKPSDFTHGSGQNIWFQCLDNQDHPPWEAPIYRRTNKNNDTGCPECGRIKSREASARYKNKNKFHCLSNINVDEKLGDCSICGKTAVIKSGKGQDKYKCASQQRETSKKLIRTIHGRFMYSVRKARKKFLEFALTEAEYEQIVLDPCYYCNNELSPKVEAGIGLDRLDSNIGYTLKNVVSCCTTCNKIKGDWLTPEETKAAVRAIIEHRQLCTKLGAIDCVHSSNYINYNRLSSESRSMRSIGVWTGRRPKFIQDAFTKLQNLVNRARGAM
jgi:hypothetical protein